MSVLFHSDELETIHRQIPVDNELSLFSHDNKIPKSSVNFEVDRCVEWIHNHGFSKVALQFPDGLLSAAAGVASEIADKSQKQIYILADTSYGSCCVDEIAAKHVSADAIIHFGHACLSITERLPVLYIFGNAKIDVPNAVLSFAKTFPDKASPVIIYYEVYFQHAIGEIAEKLKEYTNLVVSELVIPGEESKTVLKEDEVKIIKNQRCFIIPKSRHLKDYSVFYIGCRSDTFTNVMLSLIKCKFYKYNPYTESVCCHESNMTNFLKKRFYYIERTRDARIFGILIGTLGVSNYISTIKRLREAIAAANKKSYVIATGKINVAKLANFAQIDVFVNVACFDSTVVDCTGFYQPIITPYELEIAFNIRDWTGDFITDFAELLPDGAHHVPISEIKYKMDVSLITGKARSIGMCDTSDENKEESSELVERDKMSIAEIHSQAAGEFLTQSSWKGLEQKLGETPAADILQGRKGIASGYEDEKMDAIK